MNNPSAMPACDIFICIYAFEVVDGPAHKNYRFFHIVYQLTEI